MNHIELTSPDGDSEHVLASGDGWGNLARWFRALPNSPTLKELAETGTVTDSFSFRNELAQALDRYQFSLDPDTLDVAENLLENIGIGHPDERITVT